MRRSVLCVLVLALPLAAQIKEVRIRVATPEQSIALRALDLDLATCSCGSVHPGRDVGVFIHSPAEEAALRNAGFVPTVVHDDAKAFYRSRLTQPSGTRFGPPVVGQGSMGGYFTLSEIILFMDALQAQYPALMAPKVSLGQSIEGRDIWMWKISDNPLVDENEPEVLVDALHHAREPMTYTAACWLAKNLVEGHGSDPEATALVDERELFIIPVVNPDGLVYNQTTDPNGGGFWRKNRRLNAGGSYGVDLNRNYGYLWGFDNSGSSPNESSQTYRGTGPFSEPETTATKTFAENRNLSAAFSMHSYSDMFFIPPSHQVGTYAPPPLNAQYDAIGQATTALGPGWAPGTAWELLYTVNGGTLDWWYGALYGGLQTWAFGCEIGSQADGFWPPTSRILPLANDAYLYCTYVMRIAGSNFDVDGVTSVDTGGSLPGIWEPGELITLTVSLKNDGTQAGAPTVGIETTSPWLTVTTAPVSPGSVAAFGTATAPPLSLTISSAAPPFSIVSYDVVVTGAGSVPTRVTRTVTLNSQAVTVTDDDFESPGNWTSGMPGDTAVTGHWTRQDPNGTTYQGNAFNPEDDHTPTPGTDCWFTGQANPGQSAGSQDVDGTASLLSPIFDLSHVVNPEIRYWRWFATSGNGNDSFEVGLSNDGGNTWTVIDNLTSSQNTWTEVVYQVESFLPRTSEMRLYFRAADDPNNSLCEAAIDDFRIGGTTPGADLVATGTAAIGTTVQLDLSAPSFPGRPYFLGVSGSALVGIPFPPAGIAPLDPDALFNQYPVYTQIFAGFAGSTDAAGLAQGFVNVPNDPSLVGFDAFVAGLILNGGIPAALTGGVRLVVP